MGIQPLVSQGCGEILSAAVSCDVVLASCNGLPYLEEQIYSILRQTFPPKRLLISDDASTDGTVELLVALRDRHQAGRPAEIDVITRIELLLWEDRLGVTANFNRALEFCIVNEPAKYLFFSDQDDLWDATKIEQSMALMVAMESRWGVSTPLLVHSDLRLINAEGAPVAFSFFLAQRLDPRLDGLLDLAFQNVITGCTILCNKACLAAALPIPREAILHDSWFGLVASALGRIGFLGSATVSYRQHSGNLVGARAFAWSRLRGWLQTLRNGTAAERFVHPGVNQAMAIVERYSQRSVDGPPGRECAPLSPVLLRQLMADSAWTRWRAARRLGVHKQGLFRTLSWYFCLLWPRRRLSALRAADFRPYRLRPRSVFNMDRPLVLHAIANVQTGGSTRLVVDLVERLGDRYEQVVITSYLPTPAEYEGLEVHELPPRTSVQVFLDTIRRIRPALLHIHYWGGCDLSWYSKVFQAAEHLGVAVIQNVNTPVRPYRSRSLVRNVYVSEYVRDHFAPGDPLATVVYPGSDLSLFGVCDASYLLGLTAPQVEPLWVGMVYRLEPDKLRPDAIQVFIEIVRRRPGTLCLIVGGGSLLETYRDQVQKVGMESAFRFTDYVAYERLPALYRQLSLFISPVWSESFGQVSPFAMSMGVPVIGYQVGALPEILADTSLLAPPNDRSALVQIALELLDDELVRQRIGRRNRQRALKLFSVEAMIQAYADLYEEVLQPMVAERGCP